MKVENSMEKESINIRSSRKLRQDDDDFNLREWSLKAKIISRENTNSRRFSASYIRSFREDNAKSFRSNVSISSTASSPGYTLRDEIDPSTYSFTTALKALQAKTVYSWEYMTPEGLALNSKWNEAEKYICNPLSGEVPLECLSAKTLSGRSFRQFTSKITMSAPLIYPHTPKLQTVKPPITKPLMPIHQVEIQTPSKVLEKKGSSITRDMGTQSSSPPAYNITSSKSPSPARTPSIQDRSTKHCQTDADDSPFTTPELIKSQEQVQEVKETSRKEDTKRNDDQQQEIKNKYRCSRRQVGGCLSWRNLCMMRQRDQKKHSNKSIVRKKMNNNNNNNNFLCHINGC